MSVEPENPGYEISAQGDNELPAGFFVGHEEEQTRFRELLRDQVGPRRGFLGSLLGGGPKRQTRVKEQIQGRVILITGQPASGKTRLSLRLREITQKEKEFARRFRTTRLNWQEESGRNPRLAALAAGEAIPADAFLNTIFTHFVRDDQSEHFTAYKKAVEETRPLARKVTGAELEAVWEYRARALGRGINSLSNDRPLLFLLDGYEKVGELDWLTRVILEESGSQVTTVIVSEKPPEGYSEAVAPERLLEMQTTGLNQTELLRLLNNEINRYKRGTEEDEARSIYNNPETLEQLEQITQGNPLAVRITAYLLQSGLELDELPTNKAQPVETLVRELFNGALGTGHPDHLKLLAVAVLRRPEPGVLGGLLDLRQDMLSVNEMLKLLQTRYTFLFEPLSQIILHSEIKAPLQNMMLQPSIRLEEQGLARLNRRGMGFLHERLESWAENFPTLQGRLNEIKWREWALDKVWHAFWLGQEEGWREVLPLFVAALAYKPEFSIELIRVVQWFAQKGVLDETGEKRLEWLEQIAQNKPEKRAALAQLQAYEVEHQVFQQKMPRFAKELAMLLQQPLEI
jgi:hypothetical protein